MEIRSLAAVAHADPQLITQPSLLRARLCEPPAAMATTLLRPAGTAVWLKVLSPQATTVPSGLRARQWSLPAATATALVRSSGGLSTDWLPPTIIAFRPVLSRCIAP